ncbi:alpha/beta-hydrolase [Tothia fuscella]|uniref:Alpha/beta-hydrolase n=1 Tax=Tothia fuscella TaxID=1048955 RepID=A0A9P4TSG6_9PEZI|nr:alpha/beta-hydrolase [Tothia fuscella]
MKYAFTLLALTAVHTVSAQKAQCQNIGDIKPVEDPLKLFAPGKATFPCNMGAPVPLGKVPTGCAKFEIIVARGTTEPGDLGMIVGDPLVARVKRDMPGVAVRGYPVQYPAGTSGSATGVSDIQKRLEQQSKECPDEKFALAGYSQGGMVVTSATKKLSPALQAKVLAVVLYGAGEGKNVAEPLLKKTLANCAPGDFACPNSGSGPGHVSYNNEGTKWHDRSSEYVVAAFTDKPVGQKLARNPTASL